MKKLLSILLIVLSISTYSQWSVDFQGIDSIWSGATPYANGFYNDGDSVLYVIGNVYGVNTDTVNFIFMWNGNNTYKFNDGITNVSAGPYCIQKYRNNFYIGGAFWEVDNVPNTEDIAMWDGTNWHSTGIDGTQIGTVYDMAVYHDTLYVGYNSVYNDKIYAGGYYCFKVKTGPTTWKVLALKLSTILP